LRIAQNNSRFISGSPVHVEWPEDTLTSQDIRTWKGVAISAHSPGTVYDQCYSEVAIEKSKKAMVETWQEATTWEEKKPKNPKYEYWHSQIRNTRDFGKYTNEVIVETNEIVRRQMKRGHSFQFIQAVYFKKAYCYNAKEDKWGDASKMWGQKRIVIGTRTEDGGTRVLTQEQAMMGCPFGFSAVKDLYHRRIEPEISLLLQKEGNIMRQRRL
jgi:hypothetical protein